MSSPSSDDTPTEAEPQGVSRRRLFGAAGVAAAVIGAASAGTLAGRAAAASTARVSTSGAIAVIGAIWTGFSMPSSIGPMVAWPPSSRSSLAERLADCSPGMIRTLAGAVRRQNG